MFQRLHAVLYIIKEIVRFLTNVLYSLENDMLHFPVYLNKELAGTHCIEEKEKWNFTFDLLASSDL